MNPKQPKPARIRTGRYARENLVYDLETIVHDIAGIEQTPAAVECSIACTKLRDELKAAEPKRKRKPESDAFRND